MSKEPLAELRWKRKVYGMWKEGQITWEEYKNIVRACRDATRKAKVHLELNLTRDVKDNKKGLFKYIPGKVMEHSFWRSPPSNEGKEDYQE